MKKLPILLLLLAAPFLRAQEVTVSEPVSVREDYAYHIIGDDQGHVLLVRDKRSRFEVQGYDARMKLHWAKEVELDKKNPEIINVANLNGKFCVLYHGRQRNQPVLKAARYSTAANLLDSATIKVFDPTFYTPNFQVVFSENEQIALLWYIENQRDITTLAFDMQSMKLLWENTFSPERISLLQDEWHMLVSNEGDMFFILLKENAGSRQREHFIEVFDFGPGTNQLLRRYAIPLGKYLTYDVRFSYDNLNRELKAAGFFTDENISRAEGFYYLSIAPTNPDALQLHFHRFETDFIAVLTEKEKVKNTGLADVSVQDVIHRRDGGIILVGEMNKEVQRGVSATNYYNRSNFRPIIDYYYDDVFLIALHPDGNIHWKNILHKKQYSQDDDAAYSSYFLAKTPSAIRLIFNDEIKQGTMVSEYVVRANGDYDRHAVMSTERKELGLRFRSGVQISATELIIPSERRNKLKLVRVKY